MRLGVVVARPVARSFKTVDVESYYGPMCDSTVLFESPKQEGVNEYLWLGRRTPATSNLGVSPDDVFVNLVEVQRETWSFGKGSRAVCPAGRDDGKMVEGGYGPELEQTLRNLSNVLADADVTRNRSSKSTCTWLTSRTGRL